jgi:hypothetical protein
MTLWRKRLEPLPRGNSLPHTFAAAFDAEFNSASYAHDHYQSPIVYAKLILSLCINIKHHVTPISR